MTWANGPWLGFDTETTGVNPMTARLVTSCVAYRSENDSGWTRDWLADAGGEEIPEQATAVHGITTAQAFADGQIVIEVAEEVREILQQAWDKGVPVVAMNASYDLSLLNAELLRAGHRELSIDGPVLDPLVLDRMADKYRKGKRTLTDLCHHYDVRLTAAAPGEESTDGAHNAAADTLGALRLVWAIGRRYPELSRMTAAALHEAQITAHAEWAAHLTDYWRSQGKTDIADGSWPIRREPVGAAA